MEESIEIKSIDLSTKNKEKILADTSFIIVVGYFKQFINLFRGLIVAKLLDPALYGIFSGLGLILLYNSQGHLGILHGMTRELAIKKGEMNFDEFNRIKNNSMSAISIVASLIALSLLIYTFIFAENHSMYIIWGIRAYAILAFMQNNQLVYQNLLQVDHKFRIISYSRVLYSVSNLILVIILVYLFGYYGLLVSVLLATSVENFYLIRKGKYFFKFILEKEVLVRLLKIGLPISLGFAINTMMVSVDRIMIIKHLTAEDLGFYGIALTFFDLLYRIPENISYVMYPRFLEIYGKYKSVFELRTIYDRTTLIISVIVSFLIGALFIVIPVLINYILPKYEQAISVARIVIFALFFSSIRMITEKVLITIGKIWQIFWIQLGILVFSFTFTNYLLSNGNGIDSVAFAVCISYFLYSFIIVQFVVFKFFDNFVKSLLLHFKIYIPLFITLGTLYGLNVFKIMSPIEPQDLNSDIINTISSLFLYSLVFVPVFIYLNKKTDVWKTFRLIIKKG